MASRHSLHVVSARSRRCCTLNSDSTSLREFTIWQSHTYVCVLEFYVSSPNIFSIHRHLTIYQFVLEKYYRFLQKDAILWSLVFSPFSVLNSLSARSSQWCAKASNRCAHNDYVLRDERANEFHLYKILSCNSRIETNRFFGSISNGFERTIGARHA